MGYLAPLICRLLSVRIVHHYFFLSSFLIVHIIALYFLFVKDFSY